MLSTGLAIVFLIWWRSGQTLDVENLASFRGEVLFWVATLLSNSLGTSSGDFLADSLGLGFRDSALTLSAIMLLLLVGHYVTRINAMLLFWIAFVLTRPVGRDRRRLPEQTPRSRWPGLGHRLDLGGPARGACRADHLSGHRRPSSPLSPLPAPVHRRTWAPQHPNGELITQPTEVRLRPLRKENSQLGEASH
ncbi:MAG: hypothetical protein QOC69_4086 [Mycobacterium sp.]|nr:hypothetical protein [Mycobacterium sp.]